MGKQTFEEWLNNLPIQTLTDELKEDILEKFEEEKNNKGSNPYDRYENKN